jgi:hypothetical protein
VFPQGAIHFEMNPTCETAMFVASFNGEDPGVNQVAQRCTSASSVYVRLHPSLRNCLVFGLPPDIVGAALGGLGVQDVADLESLIPDNVVLGVDECLQRCGIERVAQPTAQRQPRVAANAFPAGVVGTNPFSLPANGTDVSNSTETTSEPTAGPSNSTESTGEPTTGESTGESTTGESTGESTTGESTGESTTGESTGESTTGESTGESTTTGESDSTESTGESTTGESTGESTTGESTGESSTTDSTESTVDASPADSGSNGGVVIIVEDRYPEVMQFSLRR